MIDVYFLAAMAWVQAGVFAIPYAGCLRLVGVNFDHYFS